MQSKQKLKTLTYKDAVQVFQDEDVVVNLHDACQRLAEAHVALMKSFGAISSQLRSLDKQIQGVAPPLESRWNACRKDFADIIWQQRVNAGFISGRLKMFCNVVLPLTARNINNAGSHQIHENIHVLRSYMNISSDHSTLTHSLVQKSSKVSAELIKFHADYISLLTTRKGSKHEGDQLEALAQKLAEFEGLVSQIHGTSSNVHIQQDVDVTYLAIGALRLSALNSCPSIRAEGESEKRPKLKSRSSGSGSGRVSKVSHHRLAFPADLSNIGKMYEQLETAENEILHIHYATSLCNPSSPVSYLPSPSAPTSPYSLRSRSSHSTVTSPSKFPSSSYLNSTASSLPQITTLLTLSKSTLDALLCQEKLLTLFLAIWGRLRGDCEGILRWLNSEAEPDPIAVQIPSVLRVYLEAAERGEAGTLYASIADALDVYVGSVDEHMHGPESRSGGARTGVR
ncbi:hypothetical protein D9758_005379 [Tetrapyrgos nigripes]|uniref:Uncharacterized protein n=1 Tax=Tetrapyrgos nigripes TaxID=182062 RepID=A0A8H5GI35_9AGAR|nr:hypothetical protein D9758_005379 [Tetrapyrgos nigripes]